MSDNPTIRLPNISTFPSLTLRDYFAGQVISGFLLLKAPEELHEKIVRSAAENAYALADLMLAEREKKP